MRGSAAREMKMQRGRERLRELGEFKSSRQRWGMAQQEPSPSQEPLFSRESPMTARSPRKMKTGESSF